MKVSVKAITKDLHEYDKKIEGIYEIDGENEEEVLDNFHQTIAIKVLDDFEIEVLTPGRK